MIDLLLGIDIFAQILCHGRQHGPPGSPSAFKTEFGWVLAGEVNHSLPHSSHLSIVAHHCYCGPSPPMEMTFFSISGKWNKGQVINPLSPQKKTLLLNTSDNIIHVRLKVILSCHSPKGLLPQHLVNPILRQ